MGRVIRAYGWTGQSAVLASIWGFLEQPLMSFGGAAITLWGIMTTLTILLVVIWLGQWGRADTYRWVLSQISDLGVRHSLSVFTQYAIVLIGLLIILRIIGIDLTTWPSLRAQSASELVWECRAWLITLSVAFYY